MASRIGVSAFWALLFAEERKQNFLHNIYKHMYHWVARCQFVTVVKGHGWDDRRVETPFLAGSYLENALG